MAVLQNKCLLGREAKQNMLICWKWKSYLKDEFSLHEKYWCKNPYTLSMCGKIENHYHEKHSEYTAAVSHFQRQTFQNNFPEFTTGACCYAGSLPSTQRNKLHRRAEMSKCFTKGTWQQVLKPTWLHKCQPSRVRHVLSSKSSQRTICL